MFDRELPLESETALFILLSTLDLFLTTFLMEYYGAAEANPLANFIFANWHYQGLVVFKFTGVAGICVLSQLIAHHNLKTARCVLVIGCLLMVGLLMYSLRLALGLLA
jgi:hypothetical protein